MGLIFRFMRYATYDVMVIITVDVLVIQLMDLVMWHFCFFFGTYYNSNQLDYYDIHVLMFYQPVNIQIISVDELEPVNLILFYSRNW